MLQFTSSRLRRSDPCPRCTADSPNRSANATVSSPETANIRRPVGTGPCRSERATHPLGATRSASRCMASTRSCSSRCIHTAESNVKSKGPWRPVSDGRASSIQRIAVSGWRRCPIRRSSGVGSTATTWCPRVASAAASRPLPAPMSRTLPGAGGNQCQCWDGGASGSGAWRGYPGAHVTCPSSRSFRAVPDRHVPRRWRTVRPYNWAVARQSGGTFVLRIEDTDAARNKPEWIDGIISALAAIGIHTQISRLIEILTPFRGWPVPGPDLGAERADVRQRLMVTAGGRLVCRLEPGSRPPRRAAQRGLSRTEPVVHA
ncbi:glutamyl-tRNA synthetase [Streptomyces hygroscopicus]|nr:glutamyl-tRNA synthetase [Streptomyces hygroscopicus]